MKKTNRIRPLFCDLQNILIPDVPLRTEPFEFPLCLLRVINDSNGRLFLYYKKTNETGDAMLADCLPSYKTLTIQSPSTHDDHGYFLSKGMVLEVVPTVEEGELSGTIVVSGYTIYI